MVLTNIIARKLYVAKLENLALLHSVYFLFCVGCFQIYSRIKCENYSAERFFYVLPTRPLILLHFHHENTSIAKLNAVWKTNSRRHKESAVIQNTGVVNSQGCQGSPRSQCSAGRENRTLPPLGKHPLPRHQLLLPLQQTLFSQRKKSSQFLTSTSVFVFLSLKKY